MSTAWVINAVGLFATTAGVLLIFLYLWNAPVVVADRQQASPEAQARLRHHNSVLMAVGLLAVWLVLQDLAVILL